MSKAKVLKRAVFFSVLVVVTVAAPLFAFGAVADGSPAKAVQPEGCGRALEDADFQAKGQGLEIRIGHAQGKAPMSIAQIFQSGKCVAICSVNGSASADRKPARDLVPAIDMECRASELVGMTSPAAVIFGTDLGEAPLLRLGSWVTGYRDTPLTVSKDKLSRSN